MGKVTFTVTLNETGESKSATINILEPEFIKGWWSYDKEGKNVYVYGKDKISVPLEETMYFHVETKGLALGQELTLKLYDYDYTIWDYLDPDDEKFPDEEIQKKAKIRELNGKRVASVELYLDKSWEKLIKDDSDNAFSLDETIELYWEVIYGWRKKALPKKKDDYLRVAFSERTLYFKSPVPGYNLPELMAYDGSPILLMEFTDKQIKKQVKKKAKELLKKQLDKSISNIALVKLEKGSLASNTGDIYTKSSQIYNKELYTNDGSLLSVKQRKNFGFKTKDGKLVTTKGISQFDYFSKTGKRAKIMGFVKDNAGSTLDIFNIISYANDDDFMSKPIPLKLGPLTPLTDMLGVIALEQKNDLDQFLEEAMQRDLIYAKSLGLAGIKKFAYTYPKEYEIIEVSKETANKLMCNEFKTIDEAIDFDDRVSQIKDIHILLRKVKNKNNGQEEQIIETILIDE